jgi:hypothetical protein
MKRFCSFLILLSATLATIWLPGCAHRPKVDPAIDWNSRIGNYTFEHALAEIGKPDVVAESSDGRVADWILKQSPNVSFGFGVGTGVFGRHGGSGVGVGSSVTPPPHGEYLRLVFDTQDKLKAWSRTRH